MDNKNPLSGQTANPLSDYFRQPGTYITLPSNGRFYKDKLTLSDSGELAIYPMTAKDELRLKNPDALFNGEAMRGVIKSSVPDIENVDEIPSADVDMILVAIKMASYGDDMPMDVSHNCNEADGKAQRINVSLGQIISTLRPIPDKLGTVVLSTGLEVHLRPYNLKDQGRLLKMQFDSMRNLQSSEQRGEKIEDQTNIANAGFASLVDLSQDLLTGAILKVVIPGKDTDEEPKEITDIKHIAGWLANLDRGSCDRLEDELKAFQEFGIIREITATCDYCKEDYKTDMLFDPTSFFSAGS
jgi:hypothetical protein